MKASRTLGIAAISVLAYSLCDLLHEYGHLAATRLPLGVRAESISTIGVSTEGSSAVVAAAGPAVNLALAAALVLASASSLPRAWRYFFWLFGTVNLFNAAAYLLYSAILGVGDWAVVLGAAPPALWRPIAGLAGVAAYAASVYGSLVVLRRLVASDVVPRSGVGGYCTTPYWVGGSLLTVAAVLNPVSPWLILTSGAATGFGAMAGLLLLPTRVQPFPLAGESADGPMRIGWGWILAGAGAAAVFVAVFGPGIHVGAQS